MAEFAGLPVGGGDGKHPAGEPKEAGRRKRVQTESEPGGERPRGPAMRRASCVAARRARRDEDSRVPLDEMVELTPDVTRSLPATRSSRDIVILVPPRRIFCTRW